MLLFERDSVLRQMPELSAGSCDSVRVGVVTGSAGLGKTALLTTYARVARTDFGCTVLEATCAADERCLPFGLVRQLLDNELVSDEERDRLYRALDRVAAAEFDRDRTTADPGRPELGDHILSPAVAEVAQHLLGTLRELAVAAQVIICVDDVQYADEASLHVLQFLLRRVPSGRFVVLVSDAPHVEHALPQFRQELGRQLCYYPVALEPLTQDGVRQWLSASLDDTAAAEFAPMVHEASGGNPVLVAALVDDASTGSPARPPESGRRGIRPGDAYRHAALSLLLRLGPTVRDVAEAAAVLGVESNPRSIAGLLGQAPSAVAVAVAALRACGVLGEHGYRHREFTAAVASAIPDKDRADAHLRAAQVTHDHGADARVVARHFVAAGTVPGPWAARVLLDAAAQAEAAREPDVSIACLDLARSHCTDPAERARATMSLARLEWRADPCGAVRHVDELRAAIRAGQLGVGEAVLLARWLLWFGRGDEAADLVSEQLPPTGLEPAPDADAARSGALGVLDVLRGWYPEHVPATVAAGARPRGRRLEAAACTASAALASVLTEGATDGNLTRAERVLVGCDLSDETLPALVCALETLLHSDQHAAAAGWCENLLREAGHRQARAWEALLSAVRADAALRGGDLVAARRWATFALGRISRRSWGAMIGMPLAVLLRTLVALSQFDEADEIAREVVPDAAYDCVYGLHLRRARGEYFLAIGRLHDARGEFDAWAERAQRWNCDLPVREPWRTALAQVHLGVDDLKTARDLAGAQLARPGGSHPRAKAEALLVIAAASDIRRRPAVLRTAVDLFQTIGDRVRQAVAMAELARAHTGLGEFNRARLLTRRALEVAAECGAEQLCRSLLSGGAANIPLEETVVEDDADAALEVLSDAERRVAELAVMGHTNREISSKLFITVSTVEQHLTRIYRKLGVTRRADLPLRLPTRQRVPALRPAAATA